jgi:hypothetical protein
MNAENFYSTENIFNGKMVDTITNKISRHFRDRNDFYRIINDYDHFVLHIY